MDIRQPVVRYRLNRHEAIVEIGRWSRDQSFHPRRVVSVRPQLRFVETDGAVTRHWWVVELGSSFVIARLTYSSEKPRSLGGVAFIAYGRFGRMESLATDIARIP